MPVIAPRKSSMASHYTRSGAGIRALAHIGANASPASSSWPGMKRALAVPALILLGLTARAEDREFIRALEDAQRARPSQIASVSRIAPEEEPGTALVV